jgi:hypothetical protein
MLEEKMNIDGISVEKVITDEMSGDKIKKTIQYVCIQNYHN